MNLLKVLRKSNFIALSMIVALIFVSTADLFALTIYGENFNSSWSTLNPPAGWTIKFTGDTSANDWHRKDALSAPWLENLTAYACLFGDPLTGDAPDSLISPIIDFSSYYNIVLRCSTYFAQFGGAYRAALYGSIDGGATWPYEIRNFFNQNIPAQLLTDELPWAQNQTQVRFLWVYEGDSRALAFWCIDDFSLTGSAVLDTDIATLRIRRPRRLEIPGTVPVRALFANVGNLTQNNILVNATIYQLPDTFNGVVYLSDPIDSIRPFDTIVHDFSVAPDLDTGKYLIKVWCEAAGDQDRTNDTLRRTFTVGWLDEQGFDDSLSVRDSSWIYERYGWGVKFKNFLYLDQPAFIESVKFHFGIPTPQSNQFRIRICDDDGVDDSPGTPLYESGILTAVYGWNSFNLAPDSIVIWDSSFYVFFIQVEGRPLSPELSIDQARDSSASYWVCYDSGYVEDFTTGDWMIRCVLNYDIAYPRPDSADFRTVFIGSPEENLVVRPMDRTFTPKARIENWGYQAWVDVPVVCSIISISNPMLTPYTSTKTIFLNPQFDTIIEFDPWTPDFRGQARVVVRTLLFSDTITTNNTKEETIFVHLSAFTGKDFSLHDYRWIDSDTTGGPTYSWIDTSGWFFRDQQGDENVWYVPLVVADTGFGFRFYDTTYLSIWVSSNGWIYLGRDTGYHPSGYPNNVSIPNAQLPNNIICPFWDDLVYGPPYGGGLYYKRVGTAPNRKFVVIYQDVRRKDAISNDPITFEVILHENGIITYQYKDVFCGDARYSYGRSATVGVEDSSGTFGLRYLYGEGGTGGSYPGNKLKPGLAVKLYPYKKDVALFRKVIPNKYSLPGIVTPRFRLINFGTTTINELFWTHLKIENNIFNYDDSVLFGTGTTPLEPGDSITRDFRPVTLDLGRYALKCSTALADDQINENDFIAESIFVQTWAQKPEIPWGIAHKKVKDGALAYDPVRNRKKVYGLKGGNDNGFFRYDPLTETWDTLQPVPDSNNQTGKKKKPKIGASLCYGDGRIYLIKSGNTQDFYAYDIVQDTWVELCTIPAYIKFPTGYYLQLKKPKYGAALAFAPITGRVYLLSGNRSRQFLSYNPGTNQWEVLDSIPASYPPRKVKAGGALACGGDTLFALKGSNTNEFYGYILSRDSWVTLKQVPLGTANKRVKAGGGLAYHQGKVYCFKGGNTTEWRVYYQAQDTWDTVSPIPLGQRNKKVKRGGALVAADSLIFAFKGGNTQEFWAYGPGFDTLPFSFASNGPVEAMIQKKITFGLWTYPNPAFKQIKIHYGVTNQTRIRIDVYNVLGARVKTLVNEEKPVGNYSIIWDGKADNGKRVSAGVYIAKIKQAEKTKTNKFTIAK